MELFQSIERKNEPLAYRMRPRTLDEFAGQDHIVGKGRLLRRAIQADQLTSLIFYGPPGTGKTTLARIIANTTKSNFTTINAVLSGVKDLREAIQLARERMDLYGHRTILFIDEVHRWNKSQQDALLPWVENGTVILIGATTENPYFEVNSALVSRSRIFQLKTLTDTDLLDVAKFALSDKERGYGNYRITIEDGVLEHLAEVSNGDARTMLNALQLAVETTGEQFPPKPEESIHITMAIAEESIQQRVILYDKEGDYHFDIISAFIKSIRGSDPDGALYWLAKMMKAGENPNYIFRRLLISASEDIGLADPMALQVVESAAATFDRIGLPEGQFPLAQATLYLATAPKSNSTMAFFDAMEEVGARRDHEVPNHLKDGNRDKEGFGHGQGYLYPHAYRDHWVAQQYLPTGLQGRMFYQPSDQGYEASIRHEVLRKREIQLATVQEDTTPEILTNSPRNRKEDQWLQRTLSHQSQDLELLRNELFTPLTLLRHHRILVTDGRNRFLLWEGVRQVPEGGVYTIVPKKEDSEKITQEAMVLEASHRPVVIEGALKEGITSLHIEGVQFEAIIGRNSWSRPVEQKEELIATLNLLAPQGVFIHSELIPSQSTRLSHMLDGIESGLPYKKALELAEKEIYEDPKNSLVNWGITQLEQICSEVIKELALTHEVSISERESIRKRHITPELAEHWLSPTSAYGKHLSDKERDELIKLIQNREVSWSNTLALIQIQRKR